MNNNKTDKIITSEKYVFTASAFCESPLLSPTQILCVFSISNFSKWKQQDVMLFILLTEINHHKYTHSLFWILLVLFPIME